MMTHSRALLLCLIATTAPSTGVAAQANCAEWFAHPRFLDQKHIERVSSSSDTSYEMSLVQPRGEFETKAAYDKRIAMAKRRGAAVGQAQAGPLTPETAVAVKFGPETVTLTYDADRQRFKTGTFPFLSYGKVIGHRQFAEAILFRAKPESRPYLLGTQKTLSESWGVAVVSKLRHPILRGEVGYIAMPIKQAEMLKNRLALLIVGAPVDPLGYTTYSEHDDFATKTMENFTGHYATIEVECAALVDNVTDKVVVELK